MTTRSIARGPVELAGAEGSRNEPGEPGPVTAVVRDRAPAALQLEPEPPPGEVEPGSRAALVAAIRAELEAQTAAEEPDTERLAALTRRLCLERRSEDARTAAALLRELGWCRQTV